MISNQFVSPKFDLDHDVRIIESNLPWLSLSRPVYRVSQRTIPCSVICRDYRRDLCNALVYNRQICYCQLYHLSLYVSAVTQIVKPFRNFTHANWTAEMCSVYWPNLHLLRQSNCCVVSEWSHIELSLRNRHFLCTLCFIFSFGWCLVEDYRNGDQRRPMGPCGSKRTLAF